MLSFLGIIDGAAKHVENTPIDRRAADRAELLVQLLGVGPVQVGDTPDAQVVQVASDTRANTGDLLQLSKLGLRCHSVAAFCETFVLARPGRPKVPGVASSQTTETGTIRRHDVDLEVPLVLRLKRQVVTLGRPDHVLFPPNE